MKGAFQCVAAGKKEGTVFMAVLFLRSSSDSSSLGVCMERGGTESRPMLVRPRENWIGFASMRAPHAAEAT